MYPANQSTLIRFESPSFSAASAQGCVTSRCKLPKVELVGLVHIARGQPAFLIRCQPPYKTRPSQKIIIIKV